MQNDHVLVFPGTREGFERAFADLRRTLDGFALPHAARYRCELVFEEVVTNIIKHGYADGQEHAIEVSLEVRDGAIVMRVEDDGVAFNPCDQPPVVDRPRSILDASVGGRGLLLVRGAAERLEYERTHEQRNRLTVTIGKTR
jgi:serine/threonine-protein kinase RsbW